MAIPDSTQDADLFQNRSREFLNEISDFILDGALNCQCPISLFGEALSKLQILHPHLKSGIWMWNRSSKVWEMQAFEGKKDSVNLSEFQFEDDHQGSEESSDSIFLSKVKQLLAERPHLFAAETKQVVLEAVPISKHSSHNDFLVLWGRCEKWKQSELSDWAKQLGKTLFRAIKIIEKISSNQKSDAICSALFHTSPLAMVSISTQFECLKWNPGAERIFRQPATKILGTKISLATSEHQAILDKSINRSIANKLPSQCEVLCSTDEGTEFPAKISIVPILSSSQAVAEVVLMIRDESEISAAKQELHAPAGVCSILSQTQDLQGVWSCLLSTVGTTLNFYSGSRWKRAGADCLFEATDQWSSDNEQLNFGTQKVEFPSSELEKILAGEIYWNNDSEAFRFENLKPYESMGRLQTTEVVVPLLHQNEVHSILTFEAPFQPALRYGQIEALRTIQEILKSSIANEQMQLTIEEQRESLRQTKKMEALGVMAGGITHDFNNLLTVILGNTELAMHGLNPGQGKWDLLNEIQLAGQRASSLTRRFLAFSRKRDSEPACLHLSKLISEMFPMLRTILGENITLETNFEPGCYPVFLDPVELEQVVMNLTANSRDAMPEGGQFTISLSNVEMKLGDLALHLGVQPGDFLKMSVTDTGTGMSEETRARIFEPFYTTKNVDQGTGLGLATVYGIVNGGGGFMNVTSEIDHGTTFDIYLPRTSVGIAPSYVQENVSPLTEGSETILVVEDEEVLGRLVSRILEVKGYQVRHFRHGKNAIGHLKEHHKAIDLILTDVMMPGMSGSEVIQEAKRINSKIPILVMSGYNDSETLTEQLLSLPPILEKPFTGDSLVQAVQSVFQKESTDSAKA
ncbi:PAS domain-containing hybrid sensor histidine kinase/response regulator [Thalassoglobus polymorphus]|uniref:histidine kinase n=1 Tax=Thalassoglobus polymorphus TaxID=2527994 RepID=A0A517QRC2_9PLAN|nr:PAS domain-containing hybrid sensor histidine kinase/response regulator [Thalassoglobus polymorphus]QDT34163.1 Blue-light-activated protein [Thalassoglobus polymorphus]